MGSNGIEAAYNSILNGTDGREYGYLDDTSTVEQTVKEAVDGDTVVSTIDLQVQSIVEQHILEFNEQHKNEVSAGEGSKKYSRYGHGSAERRDPGGSILPQL